MVTEHKVTVKTSAAYETKKVASLEKEIAQRNDLIIKLTAALEEQTAKVKLHKKIVKERGDMVNQLVSEKETLAEAVAERDRKIVSLQNDLYVYGSSKLSRIKSAVEASVRDKSILSGNNTKPLISTSACNQLLSREDIAEAGRALASSSGKSLDGAKAAAKFSCSPSNVSTDESNRKTKLSKLVSDVELAPSRQRKKCDVEGFPTEPVEGLANGWIQQKVQRRTGTNNVFDMYYFSPKNNIRCRSRREAKRLIAKLVQVGGDEEAAWNLVKADKKLERNKRKTTNEVAASSKEKRTKRNK